MRADAPEKILVDRNADEVSCDGGLGPLGHPVVFYAFAGADTVRCGYCDRMFIRKPD
ncbi:MAG: zinc-finger domain-containing protein [Alphaproteobacteria bacterium]|nr:zinc-finger domain-containing protein [Alphaproteobacteria bacterium]